jgi:hypothetical protein
LGGIQNLRTLELQNLRTSEPQNFRTSELQNFRTQVSQVTETPKFRFSADFIRKSEEG